MKAQASGFIDTLSFPSAETQLGFRLRSQKKGAVPFY
jgi:hypothetical protein